MHTYWCHPPRSSDGIDPITKLPQVLDDQPGSPGALCRDHCVNWRRFNFINNGSNPPRLSDCHVSWGCTAWTWDPGSAGDSGTCFWQMVRPAQLGLGSWVRLQAPCVGCTSGVLND